MHGAPHALIAAAFSAYLPLRRRRSRPSADHRRPEIANAAATAAAIAAANFPVDPIPIIPFPITEAQGFYAGKFQLHGSERRVSGGTK